MQLVAGFPYWEVAFDERGNRTQPTALEPIAAELRTQQVTDLFIFCHGWNSDRRTSRAMYERFFSAVRQVLQGLDASTLRTSTIGTLGILWPSMRWADEDQSDAAGMGGAASIGEPAVRSDRELVQDLKAVFTSPAQVAALDALADLLERRPSDEQALAQFQALMEPLAAERDAVNSAEDAGERDGLLRDDPKVVFDRMAEAAPAAPDEGGAAGFGIGDAFGRLWEGAKQALRQMSYYAMKRRAGVVGRDGVGPLLTHLATAEPDLRMHLLGHSFGARVMSFALAGMPDHVRAVRSLFLLQAAFSHFAFANSLPHERARSGALANVTHRVHGPILVSHSAFDTAVSKLYPLASVASRDDAATLNDPLFRWGALGHNGAQAVQAVARHFLPVGGRYSFTPGSFNNLDGNQLIVNGSPPAGAHGDIFHPEIAWASLSAAGLIRQAVPDPAVSRTT